MSGMSGNELAMYSGPDCGRRDIVPSPVGLLGTTDVPAPDLAALLVIDAALAPLDEAARNRVMEWLWSKWRRT